VKFHFRADSGLIVVQVEIWGPVGNTMLQLALDTGATTSLISQSRLIFLGYDPSVQANRVQITTGSSVEFAARISVDMIKALGRTSVSFPVIAHNLPPNTGIDGLLGLDFLRGKVLRVDFQKGEIELS
jgi:predicted aspartyl protease